MEIVSAIIGPIVESLMVPVKKRLGYLLSSTDYVKKLNDGMKQLEGTSVDVKNHKDTNDINTLEVPDRVPNWLIEVAKIKSDVETISSNANGCFNIKARYLMGRNACRATLDIERLRQEGLSFSWTNTQKPLGRVDARRSSMSAPSSTGGIGDAFKSRDTTFKDALKFLQQDQKTQVIALCGMGGVGKSTMMEQLKHVVEDKKMFNWIVKVVIGKQPNWHSIQKAVEENLGNPLTEEIQTTRADRLQKRFEETVSKSDKGILVILDDVWEKVELRDVGLSPLPNGVKLLLTSRNEDFCKKIAVQGNLDLEVLKVNVLDDEEAIKFFCQITKISKESDPELYEIGVDIVKKCSCLPFAIKLIAPTLISEEKSIWKDSLRRLRNNNLDENVHEIIKISYDYLKDPEDKEIFLLCSLFPEDSNIPIEDLTRYAWGLKLLNGVPTMEDGRNRIKTRLNNLRKANLLIDGDYHACVKMHDLVLAFVLNIVSKGDHASIINHGEMMSWSSDDISESFKRISLTCRGMGEFPEQFKHPNLSLLKLMHGDDSFKFPQGFYEDMEKLKVIAYEEMQYPLLNRSLRCSPNLRTLCLHSCSLMFDCSFIGDLSNLEVLSIIECDIRKLPSTFGNLKKLKVLDLTGCIDLLIDDGVLKRLVNLEELYMICSDGQSIRFTDANLDELVGCSKNLTALAIEFNALPKNISFKKLERFRISLGCELDDYYGRYKYKFENTLKLVTDKRELLDSRMSRLFDKTEVLYLQVNGVNDLEYGLVEPLNHRPSFSYLRVLDICKCADLRYLFPFRVAIGLTKLERLTISSCPILKTVVDGDEDGVGVIKLQALKFLSLERLPKLKSLCNMVEAIELPQLVELQLDRLPKFTSIYPSSSMSITISESHSFLNKEVAIPKLEKLHICNMKNLKEIWPNSEQVNYVCMLREINVEKCHSLVNLFPSNPMSLLHHLEALYVENCSSIEVLFNIDLGCIIEESSCCLMIIQAENLGNLRQVWRIKGVNDSGLIISGFQALESLEIIDCERFDNVFTPTTTTFDMRALTNLKIHCKELPYRNSRQAEEMQMQMQIDEEILEVGDTISNVLFSSDLIHIFHQVHTLNITNHKRAEVVFEIKSSSSSELPATPQNNRNRPLLPYLEDLKLSDMQRMSHVWKCDWNKLPMIPQKQQRAGESFSSFHNLKFIYLIECKKIEYLFSPLMAKFLPNLRHLKVWYCDVIEEVVSNRDDEDEELVASTSTNTNTGLFPHLYYLNLLNLPNLKRIGGRSKEISSTTSLHDQSKLPQVNDVAWSLCQYSKEIEICNCEALSYVIPSYALRQMQKLEKLKVDHCKSLVEVFDTQGFDINGCNSANNIDGGSGGNDATMVIQRINVPQLSNLKELEIDDCDLLQHVFTFSTLESLTQLKKLMISNCKAMKVIVKEDNGEQTTISSKVVVFRCLKSIALEELPNLTGFFLGKNEFEWPLLDDVKINACPQMTLFTSGLSIARKLNYIHTELGKHSLEYGLNFPVMTATLHESPFSTLDTTNSYIRTPWWSFNDLIEINVSSNDVVKNIIPSNELLQLQKLEKVDVHNCYLVEEVFEAFYGSELQYVVVEIPKLREVRLRSLSNLKHIWKNNLWMVLEFPNLTKLSIEYCNSLEHVFSGSMVKVPKLSEVKLESLENLKYIWENNPWMVLEFPNLTRLSISYCDGLEHVFSSSMVGSLLQLRDLHISKCKNMEVIVKEANVVVKEEEQEQEQEEQEQEKQEQEQEEEEGEGQCYGKVNEIITLPHLKSLKLEDLPSLKGFCSGKEDFSWPLLDTLEIKNCPTITFFTKGEVKAPELKVIDTSFGMCELVTEQDLNSFINTKQQEGLKFGGDEEDEEDACIVM